MALSEMGDADENAKKDRRAALTAVVKNILADVGMSLGLVCFVVRGVRWKVVYSSLLKVKLLVVCVWLIEGEAFEWLEEVVRREF